MQWGHLSLSLLCILGPTAVGKTELALRIATRIGGEIVSVDSRQIYCRMDVGTAKPSPEQLKLVPHHMIDCVMPDEPFSAADYQRGADKAINQIRQRGNVPILVGGSGMYFRAVVDGLFDGPQTDKLFRQKLRQEAEELGVQYLYDRLRAVDPEAAGNIHHNDLMRIIRALEVYEKSGKRISDLRQQWQSGQARYKFAAFGLIRARNELYERIEVRVDRMMAEGLLDEVRSLSEYSRDLPSMNCLGYRELLSSLDGQYDLDEAVRLIKRNTRRLAKRQLTWFRKDKRIKWIDLSTCPSPDDTVVTSYQVSS
jgi:tRNA dimethylallyltransferase